MHIRCEHREHLRVRFDVEDLAVCRLPRSEAYARERLHRFPEPVPLSGRLVRLLLHGSDLGLHPAVSGQRTHGRRSLQRRLGVVPNERRAVPV